MKRRIAVTAVLASLTLATAACGGDSGEETAPQTQETAADGMATDDMDDSMESEGSDDGMDEGMDPAANLVGPGCGDYAAANPDGGGSVEGMAQDPVAVAASNNPLLTSLTAAVSGEVNPDVDLVDTLNSGEYTVFAPVDDPAFAAVDAETMGALETDAELLTNVLTYHVVEGQLTPDQVVGEQTTLQGESVTVEGSGDALTVNGANVVCGGVQTANATVYLIDEVLMPMS